MEEKNVKFYRCSHCGNIIRVVHSSGRPLTCCGDLMTELVPNTVDAAQEKHVPVVTTEGELLKVAVGAVAHPMAEEHFIQWIDVETQRGSYMKMLAPGETPTADFNLNGESVTAVYEYCNLHGLWKL